MKTRTLKQLLLYNYRYLFGYLIVIGFILFFLGWQLGSIGPGLAQPEISTAARSANIATIIDLPLYPVHSALQWISIHILGVSSFSLRLPGILIALSVAFLLYQLMKRWFGKSTALLSTAIFISADWFLFIARFGSGAIEFSLWIVLALLSLTKLLERKQNWLLLFSLACSALLFVPFGIYASLVLIASICACRVFRERVINASTLIKLFSGFIFVISTVLAIWASINNVEFLKNLFGVQSYPGVTAYFKNLFINSTSIAVVIPTANPIISPNGIFFVRFFELIFVAFGIVMLWKTRVNRLNLTVLILTVVLVLVGGLSEGSRGSGLILIPAAIFMTAGIRHLMHRWQRTFPKNPYARIAAFGPLVLLFFCVVSLHYVSYFRLWPSQTVTHTVFTRDLELLIKELDQSKYFGKSCFIESDDKSVRILLLKSDTACTPIFATESRPKATVSIQKSNTMSSLYSKARPLVDDKSLDSTRWVVMSK